MSVYAISLNDNSRILQAVDMITTSAPIIWQWIQHTKMLQIINYSEAHTGDWFMELLSFQAMKWQRGNMNAKGKRLIWYLDTSDINLYLLAIFTCMSLDSYPGCVPSISLSPPPEPYVRLIELLKLVRTTLHNDISN